jgi:predicted RecA/RadA family phage recombinase
MKNYIHDGCKITLVAPAGGVTSGVPLLFGSLLVVPQATAAATEKFAAVVEGLVSYTKTASQAWASGDKIYWDIANAKFSNLASVGPHVGTAERVVAGGAGDTTGYVKLLGLAKGDVFPSVLSEASAAPTVITTAGAATYTIAQLLTGLIERDPNGGARTDVLPTAALLVAGIPGCKVGHLLKCAIANCADAAEAITIDAGVGGSYGTQPAGAKTIPQNITREVWIRVTNVTASSEAYTVALI